jgi:hypothetical protein
MVLVVLVLGIALLTTDFYSDRLSGSKRTFFIGLLLLMPCTAHSGPTRF